MVVTSCRRVDETRDSHSQFHLLYNSVHTLARRSYARCQMTARRSISVGMGLEYDSRKEASRLHIQKVFECDVQARAIQILENYVELLPEKRYCSQQQDEGCGNCHTAGCTNIIADQNITARTSRLSSRPSESADPRPTIPMISYIFTLMDVVGGDDIGIEAFCLHGRS